MWWQRSARCSRRPRPPRRSSARQTSPQTFHFASFLRGWLMRIEGRSMAPSLKPSDLVFVNERAYHLRPPQRGEVVAARPTALGGRALVKRLVGLPGEAVEIDGRSWELGAGQYFLLGDDRGLSVDSRRFGPVSRAELLGPVQARVWPWILLRPDLAHCAHPSIPLRLSARQAGGMYPRTGSRNDRTIAAGHHPPRFASQSEARGIEE